MKKALLIIAALTLPACATVLPVVADAVVSAAQPADAVGDRVVLEGTRALILAHNAYQAAAQTAATAIRTGRLTPAQVDAIERANARALALLNGGNTALSAADRAAGVLNAVNDLNAILGR